MEAGDAETQARCCPLSFDIETDRPSHPAVITIKNSFLVGVIGDKHIDSITVLHPSSPAPSPTPEQGYRNAHHHPIITT